MLWRTALAAFTLTTALLSPAGASAPCGIEEPCSFEDGSYHVKAPANWDGERPLPTVIFFHGYRQSGRTVMRMKSLIRAADKAGVLVVAPNGIEGTWAVKGAPSNHRDDIAFARRLTEEVASKWPIDRSRLWVSGFSLGGSMAWDIACESGDFFTGFFPVSGAFWRPHPEKCAAGPVTMLHVHGRKDRVVPVTGRIIRDRWQQGDVLKGIDFWRGHNACRAPERELTGENGLLCREWNDCAGGNRLALCLHDGNHAAPKGWYPRAFQWMEEAARLRARPRG